MTKIKNLDEQQQDEPVAKIELAVTAGPAPSDEMEAKRASVRNLISRSRKSFADSIDSLKDHRTFLERSIAEARADLHQINEAITALEAASGALAQADTRGEI